MANTLRYVMIIPGMRFNGGTIPSGLSLGGSETAGYYVAKELASRGHEVMVFSELPESGGGVWDGVMYRPIKDAEYYVRHAPHDVLIIQRVPDAFNRASASKVNLWWTHDLALHRAAGQVHSQLWNVDRILTVSDWHRKQVNRVYHVPESSIDVLPNGIDHALFDLPASPEQKKAGKKLAFIARPERGLMQLVQEGGLMERLLEIDPEITLQVAGYDHTVPEMRDFYEHMWRRCHELPNVTNMGPLGKREVAIMLQQSWLYVYPTTFEDTSCIAAMEAQAAGTPVIACPNAALPETLPEGAGVAWINLKSDGSVDLHGFAAMIKSIADRPEKWDRLHAKTIETAPKYTWSRSVDALEETVASVFRKGTSNPKRLLRHYIHHSDIFAAKDLITKHPELDTAEIETHYKFADSESSYIRHYQGIAEYERNNKLSHGIDEPLEEVSRVQAIFNVVAELPSDSLILDYGCGEGHITIQLARRFPDKNFIGVDIVPEYLATGLKWLEAHPEIKNAKLIPRDVMLSNDSFPPSDFTFCSEVLEHALNPVELVDLAEGCTKVGARVMFQTPYGPWESASYRKHPFRAHLHHFERADLNEMFGNKRNFELGSIPAGSNPNGENVGQFIATWENDPTRPTHPINYLRKHTEQNPRQTLSACLIVGGDGDTLAKCLRKVSEIADEIIIGVDDGGNAEKKGRVWQIAEEYGATAFSMESPLVQGFDEARNATIERASGDWILWIDDDEILEWPERVDKYLRQNSYTAYAVKQHHYAMEPAGLLRTDLPCRIFRNGHGIRFFGVVHEHPELNLNAGIGEVYQPPDFAIGHNGYMTEAIRRARFKRNLPLMVRDREKYPTRILGRFLWIRDLAHLCRYEIEQNGGVTQNAVNHANEAISLWRELLKDQPLRLVLDALPYYSEAVAIVTNNGGVDYALGMAARHMGMGNLNGSLPEIRGKFLHEDLEPFTMALMRGTVGGFTEAYL